MRFSGILNGLVVAAAIAIPAAAADAGTTVKIVRGTLAPAATDGPATGGFRLADIAQNGVASQRVAVYARGLDAAGATAPQFEVILDNGKTQADLGALHLATSGTRGWLRFDTRTGTLPQGMNDLSVFSGGTLHITLGGVDVATSPIPAFVEPEGAAQDPADPTNTIAFGFGSVVLGDTSATGAGPVAKVSAFAGNTSYGLTQAIAVGSFGLTRGATYTVVLTGATEGVLGTMKVSNWFGLGGLLVSTRRGDVIPGGSVSALAGRGIEIRDGSGAVVLAGTFPSIR